jgi:hypothetical protein
MVDLMNRFLIIMSIMHIYRLFEALVLGIYLALGPL